jgi:hypothetical protein
MFVFGSGALMATPLFDATGAAIVNPTPIEFGTLQDVSLDVSFDTKMLYGNLQFPVAVGRGKGKVAGKAKAGKINGLLLNSVVFGQTLTSGIISDVYDTTGVVIAATVTPTVPNAGTWTRDLGVRDANGITMSRVASAPATGQYSVSAGVYTFAAADAGKTAFISFQYTATSTTAAKFDILNLPMGYAPSFSVDFYLPFGGKSLVITATNAIANKLGMATKQDDFMVPEIDFDCFADNTGRILTFAITDK